MAWGQWKASCAVQPLDLPPSATFTAQAATRLPAQARGSGLPAGWSCPLKGLQSEHNETFFVGTRQWKAV